MRRITPVVEALLEAIPEDDTDKGDFDRLVKSALFDLVFVAPEAQGQVWIKVQRALIKYYSSPHPLAPTLDDIFCNAYSSKGDGH